MGTPHSLGVLDPNMRITAKLSYNAKKISCTVTVFFNNSGHHAPYLEVILNDKLLAEKYTYIAVNATLCNIWILCNLAPLQFQCQSATSSPRFLHKYFDIYELFEAKLNKLS